MVLPGGLAGLSTIGRLEGEMRDEPEDDDSRRWPGVEVEDEN